MNAMKIKSTCLAGIICVFLSYALMESTIYGAELEEGAAMTEAEARKLINVSYKGLSADIQKIFDAKSASCAACIKEKIENGDAPTTIHTPVHLLFDYNDSSAFIDASVDINSIKQEKFNPKFYNIKKLVMSSLDICVSLYLLEIYKVVIKTSPELAGQLMERI